MSEALKNTHRVPALSPIMREEMAVGIFVEENTAMAQSVNRSS